MVITHSAFFHKEQMPGNSTKSLAPGAFYKKLL